MTDRHALAALIDSVLEPEEANFGREVAAFCREWTTKADPLQYFRGRGGTARQIYLDLGARGWLSLCWPKTAGGEGRAPIYEFLLWDALAYYRLARPDLGSGLVARAIVSCGSEEQKVRWLPKLAAGRLCFALGYSEPGAGSDLTGLMTKAEPDGDHYAVTGEKCWTSDADNADLLWTLCRTGPPEQRSRGLTMLVIDLRAPGVTIRLIPTIDGHHLNQIFLDGVRVPVSDRVGPESGAWSMIRANLALERHLQLLPGRVRRDLEELESRISPRHRQVGTLVAETLNGLWQRLRQVEAGSIATVGEMTRGGEAVAEAARTRLLGATLAQDVARVGLELLGPDACADGDPAAFLWTQSFMETIAGGSTEMMLNILGRRSLALASQV